MKRHSRALILAFAAIALVASLASLYVHYQLLTDPSYTSFCDVSATVSCEAVYQSSYGTVAGVPVAAGGAIWAGLVLALALGMGRHARERNAELASYIFVLSTIGLAAVLYFAYASFFVLARLCLLCLTMYVAVVGIFVVSGAVAAPIASLPGRLGRDLRRLRTSPVALALAAVWLVGSVSLVAFFPREGVNTASSSSPAAPEAAVPTETLSADEIAQFEAWLATQPRVDLGIPSEGARVVVAKFNDYQCPACRQTYFAYLGIQQKYEASNKGAIKFISLDFPLESECNGGGSHALACESAAAVRMAKARNRGDQMAHWLFENQPEMTLDRLKRGLKEVAQVTNFDTEYPKLLDEVRADAQIGQRLQVSGTPTFFINGIRIGTSMRPAYFDAAIAYELKRSAAQAGGAESGTE